MGDIADTIIEDGTNALASGEICRNCAMPIYEYPGCQCDDDDERDEHEEE